MASSNYSSSIIQIFLGIGALVLAFNFCTILFFGILPHIKNYYYPHAQKRAILVLSCSFLLGIIFYLGLIFYNEGPILELIIEIFISFLLYIYFFEVTLLCIVVEALNIARNLGETNEIKILRTENEDFNRLFEELKVAKINDFDSSKFKEKCAIFIFLKIKRFPYRFFKCIKSPMILYTNTEAKNYYKFLKNIISIFCFLIPICYLITLLYEELSWDYRIIIIITDIIKAGVTVISMYTIINFCHNISHDLIYYSPLTKFFSIKLIVFLFIIQTIIFNKINVESNEYTEKEVEFILNFFILTIENFLMSFLFIKAYGIQAFGFEENKNIYDKINESLQSSIEDEKNVEMLATKY